jgi:hypothetical protein
MKTTNPWYFTGIFLMPSIIIKYKRTLISIIFCFFFFNLSFCATGCSKSTDSIIPPKDYQHNRNYFLNTYGKDDSSRALIKFFFKRRHYGKKETFVWAGIGIVSTILFITVIQNGDGGINSGSFLLGLILGASIYGGIAGVIEGSFIWLKYSRKKLLKFLIDYNAGRGLPKNIVRKRRFKNQLALPG